MPSRAPSRCTICRRIATKNGRCDAHQRKPWENPSANTLKLTSAERAYARRYMLERGETCTVCHEARPKHLELDHIIEIEDGGAHDPANWQLLCHDHHLTKTLAARRARRARRNRQQ